MNIKIKNIQLISQIRKCWYQTKFTKIYFSHLQIKQFHVVKNDIQFLAKKLGPLIIFNIFSFFDIK